MRMTGMRSVSANRDDQINLDVYVYPLAFSSKIGQNLDEREARLDEKKANVSAPR